MFDEYKYYARMIEFSLVEKELTDYKREIDTCIANIKRELETFKTVSENHCNFYGQVCRNFIGKSKELETDLNSMILDLEKRSEVIGDNIEKSKTLHSTFKSLYDEEKK